MSQMSCKTRRSISTMQVDVAECWEYCKYHANGSACCCLFLCSFLALMVSPAFFFLGLAQLYGLLDFMALLCQPVHRNPNHNRKEIKQRPQHQQLLVCPSRTTTATVTTRAATTTRNYYYNYSCSYNYKNYSNNNSCNCNTNNRTNKNPQLHQQPTTACK